MFSFRYYLAKLCKNMDVESKVCDYTCKGIDINFKTNHDGTKEKLDIRCKMDTAEGYGFLTEINEEYDCMFIFDGDIRNKRTRKMRDFILHYNTLLRCPEFLVLSNISIKINIDETLNKKDCEIKMIFKEGDYRDNI